MKLMCVGLLAVLVGTPMAFAQGAQDPSSDVDSGYSGGPVEVTLYHHIYNLLDPVPMNTQPMDPTFVDPARGFVPPTLETPAGEVPGSAKNYFFLYNSPGPVHYNVSLAEPRYHPERGLAEDLLLSSAPMTVYFYLSADALETVAGELPATAGAMPQVHVRATMRLGSDVGGDVDEGEVVTQGEAVVDIITQPNAPATEVVIELDAPTITTIPKDESFKLKVEWYQIDQGGLYYMDPQWNVHAGTNYPNRLVMTIENPIRIDYVHPQPIGDRKIAFHTAFVTPYGNYDVDLDQLQFAVTTAGGQVVTPGSGTLQGPLIIQKTWVHNHHFEPVLATWVWNYRQDGASPGDYEISVQAANFQGSAIAGKTGAFTLKPAGVATGVSSSGEIIDPLTEGNEETGNDSPLGMVPFVFAIGAALAVLTVRRRR